MIAKIWKWSPKKYKIAQLLGEGMTVVEACALSRGSVSTVNQWMCGVHEFRTYVDKITAEQDLAAKMGIMRACMRVIAKKMEDAPDDKDTALAYLKFMSELAGDAPDTELTVTFK